MEVYDLVGCMDEVFSPEWGRGLRELSDIGYAKSRTCKLPCEIERVGGAKTTLQGAVSDALFGAAGAPVMD